MKRLKQKQLGPYCQYCPAKTVRAVYRSSHGFDHFACEQHKDKLPKYEDDGKDHYQSSTFYMR